MINYTDEQRQKIRAVSKETLREFIRICEKHNLTYFVAFGTAIGVVRHGGFIPWDDDMDVVMPRKDYDRFIEIAKDEMDESFEIYGAALQKCVQGFYLQMFKKGTIFMTKTNQKWKIHPGIKLDIIPYDCVPDDMNERKAYYNKIKTLNRLYIIRNVKYPYMEGNSLSTVLTRAACVVVYYGMKLFGPSIDKIVKKYTELQVMYEGKTKNRTMIDEGNPDKWIINDDEIFPLTEALFEDIMIKLPAKNHEILTRQYGDYMTPPPISEQTGHNLAEIGFTNSN